MAFSNRLQQGMAMLTLHYVFDPLCGWCYAAEPLIAAARGVPGLAIVLHGGGMMTGSNRRAVTPQLRDYVMGHDKRIAQLTGQPFGDAYFDGLLRDADAVFDSAPPSIAILAAEAVAGRGLDMLQRVFRAHYVEGRRVADKAVLAELAQELGLESAPFAHFCAALAGPEIEQHFTESRLLLAQTGGQGFPTMVLEKGDGKLERLDVGAWHNRTTQWTDYLREHHMEQQAMEAPIR
jgi:putative protein-disulfide isomerase